MTNKTYGLSICPDALNREPPQNEKEKRTFLFARKTWRHPPTTATCTYDTGQRSQLLRAQLHVHVPFIPITQLLLKLSNVAPPPLRTTNFDLVLHINCKEGLAQQRVHSAHALSTFYCELPLYVQLPLRTSIAPCNFNCKLRDCSGNCLTLLGFRSFPYLFKLRS